jgi:hypothetical protein
MAALRLLYLEQQSPNPGAIPMRYREVGAGRIFASGGVQNISRSVRAIALAGMYDYDISNCHLAIVRELADRLGLRCPALDGYLANKIAFREGIAAYLNETSGVDYVEANKVKEAVIQLAYGAPLSTSTRVSLSTAFPNPRTRHAFQSHPQVQLLVQELGRARREIVKGHITAKGQIQNAFGVRDYFDLPKEYNRALSFVVTGVESLALDAILQRWGASILLAMHDGWIVREAIPVEEFEAEIALKTGFALRVELKEKLTAQDDCDHGCAPSDEGGGSLENQNLVEDIRDSLETKASGLGFSSSRPSVCISYPCFPAEACAMKTGVPSWVRVLADRGGGIWVTARPPWNLPPHLKRNGARGGGRPRGSSSKSKPSVTQSQTSANGALRPSVDRPPDHLVPDSPPLQ